MLLQRTKSLIIKNQVFNCEFHKEVIIPVLSGLLGMVVSWFWGQACQCELLHLTKYENLSIPILNRSCQIKNKSRFRRRDLIWKYYCKGERRHHDKRRRNYSNGRNIQITKTARVSKVRQKGFSFFTGRRKLKKSECRELGWIRVAWLDDRSENVLPWDYSPECRLRKDCILTQAVGGARFRRLRERENLN